MAYDRTKEQTIVISKEHHDKLKNVAEHDRRKLRTTVELAIDNLHTQVFSKSTKKAS